MFDSFLSSSLPMATGFQLSDISLCSPSAFSYKVASKNVKVFTDSRTLPKSDDNIHFLKKFNFIHLK